MQVKKKEIGERIKSIRLSIGYNKTEFGSLLDANSSLVSKWESGKSTPIPERLTSIAFYGQMSVDELLHGSTCNWELTDPEENIYMYLMSTECGVSKNLITNEPIPTDYEYCPYCGKGLVHK